MAYFFFPNRHVDGVDEATNCSFHVSVSPAREEASSSAPGRLDLHVDVTAWLQLRSEGPIPDSIYDTFWWDPRNSERLSNHIMGWLDFVGIPYVAQADTVRLIRDSVSVIEPVDIVNTVTLWMRVHYDRFNLPEEMSFDEAEIDEINREISMQEDYSSRPTSRACREAVEKLEMVVINGTEKQESCAVCLEEFSLGLEATKMPCSHVFHGECIVEWLDVQRFCPLCRFELPVDEESIEYADWTLPSDAIMMESMYYSE